MSEHDDEPRQSGEPVTAEIPVPFAALEQTGAADLEPPEDPWPSRTRSTGLRLRVPTAVLVALVLAAGAFWGGAAVQRSYGSTSTNAVVAGLASRFGGFATRRGAAAGTGTAAAGRFAGLGGAAPAATGTVTVIEGDTLYVTNASGAIVKVHVAPSTAVSRDAKSTLSALVPGDTVVVEGTTSKSGTVSATSVSATAAGVAAVGLGGLAGGG